MHLYGCEPSLKQGQQLCMEIETVADEWIWLHCMYLFINKYHLIGLQYAQNVVSKANTCYVSHHNYSSLKPICFSFYFLTISIFLGCISNCSRVSLVRNMCLWFRYNLQRRMYTHLNLSLKRNKRDVKFSLLCIAECHQEARLTVFFSDLLSWHVH